MRVMIGGARDPEAIELDDDALLGIVRDELRQTMGLRIPPQFVRIVRHRRGIPQYVVGHVARLQRIDALLQAHPGLILAGNSYRGVSINSCVAESGAIADRVLAHVNRTEERGRPGPDGLVINHHVGAAREPPLDPAREPTSTFTAFQSTPPALPGSRCRVRPRRR